MSSFKSLNLFGSGPHRFSLSAQGEEIVPNYVIGAGDHGTSPVGPLELDVTVTGRLVASSESALWALRDAITAQLADPPVPGTLIDNHARSFTDMSFISYKEHGPTDRARTRSIAYSATFRCFAP
jgi:hypothetical protein